MLILHLTADHPDPLGPAKTRAVANLLDLVPEHRHVVYSLNRVGWRHGIWAIPFGDANRAVAYGAPPHGLWLTRFLGRLTDWIADDLARLGLRPDLVHAHKLSVEAVAAAPLAERLGVPLVISCQGNSDLKIVGAKPGLRPLWRRLWQEAAVVLPFAPWTEGALAALLGRRRRPTLVLPCPTQADRILAPRIAGPMVRAAFGLDEHRNKNAALVIDAVALAASAVPRLTFEIAGGGTARNFAALAALGARLGAPLRLVGPVAQPEMQPLMNGSACLVVPSRRESYGMVFAEALLAGCPVIHGRGNGIAGYFDGAPFARPAAGDTPAALARQIVEMLQDEAEVKAALARAQRDGALDLMTRPAIVATYRRALALATGERPAATGAAARLGEAA